MKKAKNIVEYYDKYDILRNEGLPLPEDSIDADDVKGIALPERPGIQCNVPKHKLHIDSRYQREITSERRVLHMATNWNWHLYDPILVSRRRGGGGGLWVYDGGHRLRAALLNKEIIMLPAVVHDGMKLKEEAAAFYHRSNSIIKITSIQKHKSALLAGDGLARAVEDIVSDHNYQLAAGGNAGTFAGVVAIYEATRKDEYAANEAFCGCAMIADGEKFSADLFNAVFFLYSHFAKKDIEVLDDMYLKNLIEAGPQVCHVEIKRGRVLAGGRKSKANDAQVLMRMMNKKKRKNRLSWD